MSTISIRLSKELERRLDEKARAAHKRRSEVVRDALSEYIERRERDRLRAEMGAAAHALASEPAARAETHRIAEESQQAIAMRCASPSSLVDRTRSGGIDAPRRSMGGATQSQHRSEIGKVGPVLILQGDYITAQGLPKVLVAPLTTQLRRSLEPLRVHLAARDRLRKDSHVMTDQIRALDRTRFGEGPLARLEPDELTAIERSLRVRLGMD